MQRGLWVYLKLSAQGSLHVSPQHVPQTDLVVSSSACVEKSAHSDIKETSCVVSGQSSACGEKSAGSDSEETSCVVSGQSSACGEKSARSDFEETSCVVSGHDHVLH